MLPFTIVTLSTVEIPPMLSPEPIPALLDPLAVMFPFAIVSV
jgi:hypothetical protein